MEYSSEGAERGKKLSLHGLLPWTRCLGKPVDRSLDHRGPFLIKRVATLFLLCTISAFCQSNSGELRLKVTDPSGRGVKTAVHIVSEANQYRSTLFTDDQGNLDVHLLPYGRYRLDVEHPGFTPASESVADRKSVV